VADAIFRAWLDWRELSPREFRTMQLSVTIVGTSTQEDPWVEGQVCSWLILRCVSTCRVSVWAKS